MNLNRLKPKSKRNAHLSGRITNDLNNQISRLASRYGVSKSDIIRMGLEFSLPHLNRNSLKLSK
jgi:hypothetical protein